MLQACLNGARRPSEHPWLPVTAAALAADAARVVSAGAGALHVHPKTADGADSLSPDEVDAVVTALRAAVPGVPVGVTTGAWTLPDPAERVRLISRWSERPDFASVNWHEEGADDTAAALLEQGIALEAGLWHRAGLNAWLASPHRDDCLRILLEVPGSGSVSSADDLLARLRAAVPEPPPVLLHGEDASTWPILRHAVGRFLDTRIGLEDTLVRPDGQRAGDNEDLVRAAVTLGAG